MAGPASTVTTTGGPSGSARRRPSTSCPRSGPTSTPSQRFLFELGVDARQLANAGHEPFEPVDVARQHVEKPDALGVGVGAPRHFRGAPDCGQWVPELVRDVAGELLDGADVLVEPACQFRERPRQVAQFIPAARVLEAARQPAAALGEIGGLAREPRPAVERPSRPRRRSASGREDRCDDHLEDAKPHVVERLQDAECRLRHQHGADDACCPPDRHGAVERERALTRRGTRGRAVPTGQGGRHLWRRSAVDRRGSWRTIGAVQAMRALRLTSAAAHRDDPGADAVEHANADAFAMAADRNSSRRTADADAADSPVNRIAVRVGEQGRAPNRRRGAARRRAVPCGSATRRREPDRLCRRSASAAASRRPCCTIARSCASSSRLSYTSR